MSKVVQASFSVVIATKNREALLLLLREPCLKKG